MTKLTIQAVEKAAKQVGLGEDDRLRLVEMLADMTAEVEGEEKPPAVKKQFVVLVSDPLGKLPPSEDFVAWVLQIPEDESPATTQDRIFRAAYDFNAGKRGRLMPVQTVGEALENVKAKHFKEAEVWVKTKTPVLVIKTNNEIPGTDSVLGDDRGGKRHE